MRITYITGSMPPIKCGIGYYSSKLLDELSTHDEITVITSAGTTPHTLANRTLFTKNWTLRQLPALVKLIISSDPEVIHIQYPTKGYGRQLGINFLIYALKLRYRKPIVVTLHEYFGSGILGKTRNIITVLFANKITVSNRRDLTALPSYIRRKTVIVPIGSNIPLVRSNPDKYNTLLKTAGIKWTKKPILFFGFAFPNKGLETLIDASVQEKLEIVLLTELSLDNPYHAGLQKKIDESNSKGAKIYVAGFLDDETISQIFQESEILVIPLQNIPLTAKSGTAIAGAIHGLALVSTSPSAITESEPFVSHKNCILISDMNPENLASELKALEHNKKELHAIRINARELAEYYSWNSIAIKLHDTYEKVRDA